jgi:hypothetical protein
VSPEFENGFNFHYGLWNTTHSASVDKFHCQEPDSLISSLSWLSQVLHVGLGFQTTKILHALFHGLGFHIPKFLKSLFANIKCFINLINLEIDEVRVCDSNSTSVVLSSLKIFVMFSSNWWCLFFLHFPEQCWPKMNTTFYFILIFLLLQLSIYAYSVITIGCHIERVFHVSLYASPGRDQEITNSRNDDDNNDDENEIQLPYRNRSLVWCNWYWKLIPYDQVQAKVIAMGFYSKDDWDEFVSDGRNGPYIPSHLDQMYSTNWTGWEYFMGLMRDYDDAIYIVQHILKMQTLETSWNDITVKKLPVLSRLDLIKSILLKGFLINLYLGISFFRIYSRYSDIGLKSYILCKIWIRNIEGV